MQWGNNSTTTVSELLLIEIRDYPQNLLEVSFIISLNKDTNEACVKVIYMEKLN